MQLLPLLLDNHSASRLVRILTAPNIIPYYFHLTLTFHCLSVLQCLNELCVKTENQSCGQRQQTGLKTKSKIRPHRVNGLEYSSIRLPEYAKLFPVAMLIFSMAERKHVDRPCDNTYSKHRLVSIDFFKRNKSESVLVTA
jgi:hypothetical protein